MGSGTRAEPEGEETGRLAAQAFIAAGIDCGGFRPGAWLASRSIQNPAAAISSQVTWRGASQYRTFQPLLQVSVMTRTSK